MIVVNDNEKLLLESGIKVVFDGKEHITPIVLEPTSFEKCHFDRAMAIQPQFNQLVASLAASKEYLMSICESAATSDPEFTGRLYKIAEKITDNSGYLLNVIRSDYMVDEESSRLLQVELNTTCCALGSQSDRLSEYYRQYFLSIPINGFVSTIADAFIQAHKSWCSSSNQPNAVIAFVVMENERNFHDQAILMAALQKLSVPVKRVHLSDPFTDSSGFLAHNGDIISILYFRTGYMPNHYQSELAWSNRELMESSRAIKVPNILSTLAGLKVVQQSLTDGNFIAQHCMMDLSSTFAEQYSLGSEYEESMKALEMEPNSFVLKPQREGGGNNIYGAQVIPFLQSLPRQDRHAFILMRLIKPRHCKNVPVLRFGHRLVINEAVQELGIFGVFLSTFGKIDEPIINRSAGWMMRTKDINSQEGAVGLGLGFLDCPSLN